MNLRNDNLKKKKFTFHQILSRTSEDFLSVPINFLLCFCYFLFFRRADVSYHVRNIINLRNRTLIPCTRINWHLSWTRCSYGDKFLKKKKLSFSWWLFFWQIYGQSRKFCDGARWILATPRYRFCELSTQNCRLMLHKV